MLDFSLGIRGKLVVIFIVIKVLPLIVLAWFSADKIIHLASTMTDQISELSKESRTVVKTVTDMSAKSSIDALDKKSQDYIERLTTDTASAVANFLYYRDDDIRFAAGIKPTRNNYDQFVKYRVRPVILHKPWIYDDKNNIWKPAAEQQSEPANIKAVNRDNERDFHYRPPSGKGFSEKRPLYLEITYIDTSGQEQVKVVTSPLMSSKLRDVSKKENTFCKAETYFEELKELGEGDIYVSNVIGAHLKGHIIGTYTKTEAKKRNIPFKPEESGYAGKENPLGKRFQGIIRWAMPVFNNGEKTGYVTLALDHTHVMEFTDHIVPSQERYSPISDGGSGNYAFMWDYKGRCVSHARDYFIVGYDPETGEPAIPWLSEGMHERWQKSELPIGKFLDTAPTFLNQSLEKKPAKKLTRAGLVGLDGRFLNFAPQCTGWHNITQLGGSGSFLIFWSGLWKLTTVAAIPYHTGRYGNSPRGFGYVTIGANVYEFHKPAMVTKEKIEALEKQYLDNMHEQNRKNSKSLEKTLEDTIQSLTFYTIVMIISVMIIAVWMASTLTNRITQLVEGIQKFQKRDMTHRITVKSNDEMGQLSQSFNEMADNINNYIIDIEDAGKQAEHSNSLLKEEIAERKKTEEELARHKENLENLVKERTEKLEIEINERKEAARINKELGIKLRRSEKMEAIGMLAGGVAHDLNNILTGVISYPELLLMDMEVTHPMHKELTAIQRSGERAATIVQDLLTLGRRGVIISETVNLNTIVFDYLNSLEHSKLMMYHPGVTVEKKLDPDLLNISGSPVHLAKTVMNLMSNAAEAMPDGGSIVIKTENISLEEPVHGYSNVVVGKYALLIFTDNGTGISKEDMEHIFEPFYTKKKMGRSGTGLGMSVVWGTIEDHQGYIDMESTAGEGTRFLLYFPVSEEVAGEVQPPVKRKISYGKGESLLVIDDVKLQRDTASLILSKLGYSVETVASGEEAVEYLKTNSADLLLLDMIMEPGMDGLDTYREIIKLHPNQKAIIVSGFSETDRLKKAKEAGAGAYIKKPYSIEKISVAVRKELDSI
jgi:signal transduction histidine kinase/HAMP domain-containing protein